MGPWHENGLAQVCVCIYLIHTIFVDSTFTDVIWNLTLILSDILMEKEFALKIMLRILP